jgi:hypothetical protein
VTVAICPVEGFEASAFTAFWSEVTEDWMALAWLGKSLLAELTSAVASVWIFLTCGCRPLIALLAFRLVSPLAEFWRLVRSVQHAGLRSGASQTPATRNAADPGVPPIPRHVRPVGIDF